MPLRLLRIHVATWLVLALLAAALLFLNIRLRTVHETVKLNEFSIESTAQARGWPLPYRIEIHYGKFDSVEPLRVRALLSDIAVGLVVLGATGFWMEKILLRKAK